MSGRGAVVPALLFWAGLLAGSGCGTTAAAIWLAGAALLGLLSAFAHPRTGAALVLACAFAAGAARGGAREARHDSLVHATPAEECVTRLLAIACEPPRLESGEPVVTARVLAGEPLPRGARVRLRLPAAPAVEWGDTLRVLARLERDTGARVPGGFDARAAAAAAGVALRGRAFTLHVSPARGAAHAPVAIAMRLRRAMERALARELSPRARELAAPLLFGDRSAMSPETDASLRASGLVHLLALSGLHVAWFAAVARGVCAAAGGGRVARALAGAACAAGYALLAGPIPSLARAVAGETLAAAAKLAQRAHDPVQTLAVGALALLAAQPGWARDLGFQLSCAATLGLVTLAEPFVAPLAGRPRLQALARPLATTAAAQLVALPLLLERFHALPWTGLAANLVAVPLSELLLAAAWLGGVLEALAPGLGAPWLPACEPLAWGIGAVAAGAASWPGALLATGHDAAPAWLAAVGAGLLAWFAPAPRALDELAARRPVAGVFAALGAATCGVALTAALAARALAPPPGTWWLVVLDVGQGDALAIADARGWWLVDAGPRSARWDAGEGTVLPFLRWAGVRRLERLVVTHDDADHAGGVPAVRRGAPPRATFAGVPRPGVTGPAARFAARTLARGDTLQRAPLARVCWPPRPGEPGDALARRGDNAAAVVLEVGEGEARALLTADADSLVEAMLAVEPGVALLKAGHHGSGSSSGATFAARVRPRIAIISAGRRNAYGHPHPGAIARLRAAHARVDRTDREGTLWYVLGPGGVERLDWRAGQYRPARSSTPRPPPAPRP